MSPLRITFFAIAALVFSAAKAENTRPQSNFARPASIPFPDDNPFTQAKADLGKRMFFDPQFSSTRTISCASCHIANVAWSDTLSHARGVADQSMSLRTPTLLNVAWLGTLGWDGKFHSLESVAFTPITGKLNMNLPEASLIARLSEEPGYPAAFSKAFGDPTINRDRVESALATFERTIVSSRAPFDDWIDGNETAINDAAKRGFGLFTGKARCAECHSGWSFTDGSFHDIGTATDDDTGRGRLFPTSVKLRYAFKTPSLRDVARRPPYMHTGAIATLEQVIELYDRGGIDRPSRSEVIRPLHLTSEEKSDLLAFLQTLSGKDDQRASIEYQAQP